MTATAEAPVLSQPDTSDLYMARRRNLILTIMPRYPIIGPSGMKTGEHPGKRVEFSDGSLRVPKTGTMLGAEGQQLDVDEVRAFLEGHRLKNDLQEGFWRVDPTAPPVSEEETALLMRAAMRLDTDTLRSIIDAERAGWNRQGVIGPAQESLDEIEAALAAREAEPEAKPKAGGKS